MVGECASAMFGDSGAPLRFWSEGGGHCGDGGAIEITGQSGSNTTTLTVNGCTFEGNRSGKLQ